MDSIDFEQIFGASPNAYMVLDRELRFVAANAAYLKTTGRSAEELLGRNVFEVFPHEPDDPQCAPARLLRESLVRVLESGEPESLALLPYRLGGDGKGEADDVHYWSANHTPLRDAQGSVAFVLQHTVDVTEVKRLEDAVRQAAGISLPPSKGIRSGVLGRAEEVQAANEALCTEQQRLHALLELAPGFLCFLRGPDHVVEQANGAFLELLGQRSVMGRSLRAALPEVEGQGFFELLDQVRDTGQPFVGRGMRVKLGSGAAGPRERFLDFLWQPVFGPEGEHRGIVVQGQDCTEQKRLELEREALLARERAAHEKAESERARLRRILDQAPVAVGMLQGPEHRIAYVNPRMSALLGEGADALMGAPNPTEMPGSGDAKVSGLEHVWRTRTPFVGTEQPIRVRLDDGSLELRYVNLVQEPLWDAAGRIEGVIAAASDVTEVVRQRQHLELLRAEAEEGVRLRDEFLSVAGHELRTPLTPLSLKLETLQRELVAHGGCEARIAEKDLRIMRRQVKRLSDLIGELLDVSRITSGRVSLQPEEVELGGLVREVLARFAPEAERAGCPVELTVEGQVEGLWDPLRLEQIVSNLLANAFKYGTGRPVHVRVERDGSTARLTVRDEGIGIPESALERIFEKFERGVSDRHHGGLGLGLYVTRQIVEACGGTARAESGGACGDCGATFIIELPLEFATEAPMAVGGLHV